MANNRLIIVDEETGEELCIAKSMGDGWYPSNHYSHLEEWLHNRDLDASIGNTNDMKPTNLKLVTENNL